MIHRIAEDALSRLASQLPMVGVTGPRQSGKPTEPGKNILTGSSRFHQGKKANLTYYRTSKGEIEVAQTQFVSWRDRGDFLE